MHAGKSNTGSSLFKVLLGTAQEGKREPERQPPFLRDDASGSEQSVGGDTDVKGQSDEVSHGNEKPVSSPQRKGDPISNWNRVHVAGFLWKGELVGGETGCLAEAVSKQSVEEAAWFFPTVDRQFRMKVMD